LNTFTILSYDSVNLNFFDSVVFSNCQINLPSISAQVNTFQIINSNYYCQNTYSSSCNLNLNNVANTVIKESTLESIHINIGTTQLNGALTNNKLINCQISLNHNNGANNMTNLFVISQNQISFNLTYTNLIQVFCNPHIFSIFYVYDKASTPDRK
jgi:hypothetical protein